MIPISRIVGQSSGWRTNERAIRSPSSFSRPSHRRSVMRTAPVERSITFGLLREAANLFDPKGRNGEAEDIASRRSSSTARRTSTSTSSPSRGGSDGPGSFLKKSANRRYVLYVARTVRKRPKTYQGSRRPFEEPSSDQSYHRMLSRFASPSMYSPETLPTRIRGAVSQLSETRLEAPGGHPQKDQPGRSNRPASYCFHRLAASNSSAREMPTWTSCVTERSQSDGASPLAELVIKAFESSVQAG